MDVTVLQHNGSIVFELQPATGFVTFVVSSEDEQVQWELKPLSLRPAAVIDSKMVTLRVPTFLNGVVQNIAQSDEPEYPALSRVVYGEVPEGYRQLAPADRLERGREYAVLILGRGLDGGGSRFIANSGDSGSKRDYD